MATPLRNTLSIVILPGTVLCAVPSLLLQRTGGFEPRWPLPVGWAAIAIGAVLLAAGLLVIAHTIRLFVLIGRGTLAPWASGQSSRLTEYGGYAWLSGRALYLAAYAGGIPWTRTACWQISMLGLVAMMAELFI